MFERMAPLEYLARKKWPHRLHKNQVYVACPFCGYEKLDGSAAMNPETGAGNCKHENRCGKRWNFLQFREATGDATVTPFESNQRREYQRPDATPPPENAAAKKSVADFLASRGFSPGDFKSIADTGVRACLYHGNPCLMFPVTRDGELINRKFRYLKEGSWKNFSTEKDAEPGLVGRDLVEDLSGELILVEGEIDYLTLKVLGESRVVSIPNASDLTWIDGEWLWLQGFSRIYIMTDMDEAGEKAAANIAVRLGRERCSRVRLPMKDANECFLKGGMATRGAFNTYLLKAEDYRPDILKPSTDIYEQAFNIRDATGDDSPWPTLTHRFKGFRMGESTFWAGDNGTGKTTVILNLLVFLASRKIPVCIGSFEMKPARYLNWIAHMILEDEMEFGSPEHKEHMRRLSRYMYIIDVTGGIAPEALIEAYKYAARRYGVCHFFTDNLMMIDIREDDYTGQSEFVKRLQRELVMECNIHHHLVCHSRKGQTDKETGRDKVSIKGPQEIPNIHDNGIMVIKEENAAGGVKTWLKVKKCREVSGGNSVVKLQLVERRKIFVEVMKDRDDEPAPQTADCS